MFIGHFALALGAKKVAPRASLGTLFMAAQLADLIWPTLVLLGIETLAVAPGITAFTPLDFISYPYSHSLIALIVWGAALGSAYALARKGRAAESVTIALLVLSHWVLDVITHRPDMPVSIDGATKLGLGLWNSIPGTILVEGLMFVIGVMMYARTTRPVDRTGKVAFWSLVGFLVVVYVGNLFGPPPPSATAVAWVAESIWLLVAWGYWIDRHRVKA
jgi:FtsH-binding integral membrane protein